MSAISAGCGSRKKGGAGGQDGLPVLWKTVIWILCNKKPGRSDAGRPGWFAVWKSNGGGILHLDVDIIG